MLARKHLTGALALSGVIACTNLASAVTVDLAAAKDVTLYENASGDTANGSGSRIFVGNTNDSLIRRGLIHFNVNSFIPANSTINSVTLTLYVSRTEAGPETVTLHRVTSDWGEGASNASGQEGAGDSAELNDATWIYTFYDTALWSSPGGDFIGTASASQSVAGPGVYVSWTGAGLVADVQDWVDGNAFDYGWMLIGNESVSKTAKRFETHEANNSSQHPVLTIDYTPPVATGACCLPDGSCTDVTFGTCSSLGGTYHGDGVSCGSVSCPQPTGSCWLPDGSCSELTEVDCLAASGEWQGALTDCTTHPAPLLPYVDALPIPPVMPPTSGTSGGAAHYDIYIQQLSHQFHRDLPLSTVWGYNGTYPGRTIEARTGHLVTTEWFNDLRDSGGTLLTEHYLDVDTTLHGPNITGTTPVVVTHLHGGHVAPASDGFPELSFPPGSSSGIYEYPNNQQAGTLWYHDHGLGITRLNVYMGLAGFYLVRDDVEDALNIPTGEFEIPLAIQDRSFNPDGSLDYPDTFQETFFGDYIVVNGKVAPYLNVKQGKYRFRMLGGANSRTFTLALSNGADMVIIGNEGGLLPAPITRSSLTITPGERYDVIIDFESYPPGTEIELLNSAPSHYPGTPGVGVVPEVMKFIVQDAPGHTDAIPASLRAVPPIPESESVMTRDFVLRFDPGLGEWLINGLAWHDITEEPVLGTTEIWRFINRSAMSHPMHMHLVFFQGLDRQDFDVVGETIVPVGSPVPVLPEESGWKDTIQVPPNQIVRVIARFTDYAGQFAYHCHILEHEDHEMMRQFRALPECPGDLNYDRFVDGSDLGLLLSKWGTSDIYADMDADGDVDGADLGLFLAAWGQCPDPPPDFVTPWSP
ncbi:MAG: multicopper oxidase domain-containing protein [Planctomycetota bacterium]|jgi:spore coat protein A